MVRRGKPHVVVVLHGAATTLRSFGETSISSVSRARSGECPAPESQEFRHALDTLGVPTQLVMYAGEGHGLHLPKDRADATKRSIEWFARYLGVPAPSS